MTGFEYNQKDSVLLLVGNDRAMIHSLQNLFQQNQYQVITASSGEDALRQLHQTNVASQVGVIISENKMLTMSGIRFFWKAKEICPNAARILISTELDMVSAMAAVNESGLFRVFTNPWRDENLLQSVRQAFVQYNLIFENQRLTEELEQANKGLILLNADLGAKVKEKAEELIHALHYDALTGLPSRQLLMERLNHTIRFAKHTHNSVTILYIGLDNFTRVNEGINSAAGNELLKLVADRISSHLHMNDTLARIGGDEFCMVMSNENVADEADVLAKSITDLMLVPFEINGREIFNTASVGISLFPDDGVDAELLVSKAQTAMRQVKADGKNHFQYYSKRFNYMASKRLAIESELRTALSRNEFVLFYQPRVNTESGRIVGVEALLRWRHPQKGLVSPLDFLPILEETGLIESVGTWVLKEACRASLRWQEKKLERITIAVNLSAKQFKSDIIDLVLRIAEHTHFDLKSSCLELEITESLLMENMEKTRRTLTEFKNMGINLALDDFGTGYSSLSYLAQFPLHYLKIDRTFVAEVNNYDSAKSVIEAIISLARALHLEVIAEGVETQEQLDTLKALGCKEFQGYLFSVPLSEEDLIKLLESEDQLCLIPPNTIKTESSASLGKRLN